MRLLHSRMIKLQEFFGNATPAYAILSHTWGKEEVTYQDMQGLHAKEKAGYTKIQHCCDQAARDGFDFVWIDTCCIDKSSSAELSEAINSMFRWYKNAKACYAYLTDVPLVTPLELRELSSVLLFKSTAFASSRWFSRGWTLQELIAPSSVEFYAHDWTRIGTKEDLSHVLSQITGIDELTLKGRNLTEVSVAKRMSWASKRVTTRTEDIAYCLLGIFGVNLPLLYGEGEGAFIRLQEEIMRTSDDQSLFAWEDKSAADDLPSESSFKVCLSQEDSSEAEDLLGEACFSSHPRSLRGFLARSPAEFENSRNIIPYRNWDVSMPYSMTNQGLRMQLPVLQYDGYDDYIGILACQFEDNFLGPLGVYIQPVASAEGDQFARDVSHSRPIIVVPEHVSKAVLRTVFIRQQVLLPSARDYDRKNHFLIRTLPYQDYVLSKSHPHEYWNESQKILRSPDGTGALLFEYRGTYITKPLSFLVIIRSNIPHEGAENEQPSCSCSIVVNPVIVSGSGNLAQLIKSTPQGTSQNAYGDLNPWNRHNKETAIAKISKEVFMGQEMFVVDIGVRSMLLKRVPFFAIAEENYNSSGPYYGLQR